jgi:hypothetical protein
MLSTGQYESCVIMYMWCVIACPANHCTDHFRISGQPREILEGLFLSYSVVKQKLLLRCNVPGRHE